MHAARQRLGPWTRGGAIVFPALLSLAAGGTARGADAPSAPVRLGGDGLEAGAHVGGRAVEWIEVDGAKVAWSALENGLGRREGVERPGGGVGDEPMGERRAIEVAGTCAGGRGAIVVDGVTRPIADTRRRASGGRDSCSSAGEHLLSARVTVSGYERRIACGEPARVGRPEPDARGGLVPLWRSRAPAPTARVGQRKGGGFRAARARRGAKPGALLVLPHPWNGSDLDVRGAFTPSSWTKRGERATSSS